MKCGGVYRYQWRCDVENSSVLLSIRDSEMELNGGGGRLITRLLYLLEEVEPN